MNDNDDVKMDINDLYDALLLLPVLYDYPNKHIRRLAKLALCINNTEAVIDLLSYYGGTVLRIPKLEDVELTIRMLSAYKENMDKGVKATSSSYYTALYNNNIKMTEENKKKFKEMNRYFKSQRNSE